MGKKIVNEDAASAVRNKVAFLLAWPADYQPDAREANLLRHFGECHRRWDTSNRRPGMSLNVAAEEAVKGIKRQYSKAA